MTSIHATSLELDSWILSVSESEMLYLYQLQTGNFSICCQVQKNITLLQIKIMDNGKLILQNQILATN